jgi:hypothetical protein
LQVKAHEHPLRIREVPDDFPDGLRELSHESGKREDLIALGELGILQQVNDLDAILASQMFFADLFEVAECLQGFRGLPCYVKLQLPFCERCFAGGALGGRRHFSCDLDELWGGC